MLEIQKLLKEKREAFNSVKDLKERVTSENRLFSTEEENMYKALVDKMNECQRSIEILESMNELNTKMKENVYDGKGKVVGTVEEDAIRHRELLHKWMRVGTSKLTPEEQRILRPEKSTEYNGDVIELRGSGVLAGGAYLQTTDVMQAVAEAKRYYGGWLVACDEFTTAKGNPITYPTVDDTGLTGALEAADTDAFAASDAITFTSQTLNAWIMSSQGLKVANNFLDDADFDMGRIVGDLLGKRLWRAISTYCTTGTGTTMPTGIAATTATTATSPLGVLAGKCILNRARLLQLMGKVDYAYHLSPGCGWMMNSKTMYELAGVSTSSTDGRPLWQPSMVAGVPDKIEGFPFWINNDLTAPTTYAANSRHVLFGDFKQFKIRYAGPTLLVRLSERYAELLDTGFIALQRVDSKLLVPNATTYAPVKYLRKLNT